MAMAADRLSRLMHEEASYSYVPPGTTTMETPDLEPPAPPAPKPTPEPEPPPNAPPGIPEYRANAGTPGYFEGGPTPLNLAILVGSNVKARPADAWARQEYIRVGDTSEYSWTGEVWHAVELVGPGDNVTDPDVADAVGGCTSPEEAADRLNDRGGLGANDLELVPVPAGAWTHGEVMTVDGRYEFHFDGTCWVAGAAP